MIATADGYESEYGPVIRQSTPPKGYHKGQRSGLFAAPEAAP